MHWICYSIKGCIYKAISNASDSINNCTKTKWFGKLSLFIINWVLINQFFNLFSVTDKTAILCRLAFTIQSKRISCSLCFWTCLFPILSPSFHPFPQFNTKLQIFTVIMLLKIFLAVCQVVCFQVGQAQGFWATEILASGPAYLTFHKNTTTIL